MADERRYQLPDELVQELLERIDEKGKLYAKAKSFADVTRERRKIVKSQLMKIAEASGIGAHVKQERDAYSNPQYMYLVEVTLLKAIEDEFRTEVEFKNAEREWESWRTISANERKRP